MANFDRSSQEVADIKNSAISLPSDSYGNPRYYVSAVSFMKDGNFWRPANASAYRGKKYGKGWGFQTYDLESTIAYALNSNEI